MRTIESRIAVAELLSAANGFGGGGLGVWAFPVVGAATTAIVQSTSTGRIRPVAESRLIGSKIDCGTFGPARQAEPRCRGLSTATVRHITAVVSHGVAASGRRTKVQVAGFGGRESVGQQAKLSKSQQLMRLNAEPPP